MVAKSLHRPVNRNLTHFPSTMEQLPAVQNEQKDTGDCADILQLDSKILQPFRREKLSLVEIQNALRNCASNQSQRSALLTSPLPLYHILSQRSHPPLDILDFLLECYGSDAAAERIVTKVAKNAFWHTTPLHACCEASQSVEALERLLDACPNPRQALKTAVQGRWASAPLLGGYLPLHAALIRNAHHSPPVLEIVQMLLQIFPAAAQKPFGYGNLPLHLAAKSNASVAVLETLILHCPTPNMLLQPNDDGRRLLHMACAANQFLNLDTLDYILQFDPSAIHRGDRRGQYPLQIACQCMQPLAVIQRLVEQTRKAVDTNSNLFRTVCQEVVHKAINGIGGSHYNSGDGSNQQQDVQLATGPSSADKTITTQRLFHLDMILYLLQEFPEQVQEEGLKDYFQRGSLPLHLLLTKKGNSVILEHEKAVLVEQLVELHPPSVFHCHHEYGLPLVLACTRGNSTQVLNHLTAVQDGRKQSPLEFALQYCSNLQTIVNLDTLYPNAIAQPVSNGKQEYLMHVACRFGHRPTLNGEEMDSSHHASVLACLRKRFPAACTAPDSEGNLPLHLACQFHENTFEVLSAASKNAANAWTTPNHKGELPLHVLLTHDWWLRGSSIPKSIDRFPAAIEQRNTNGDLPLHLLFKSFANFVEVSVPSSTEALVLGLLKRLRPRKKNEFQDGLYRDHANNDTPLHLAVRFMNQLSSVIERIVQTSPSMLQHANSDGLLPMHEACRLASATSSHSNYEERILQILKLLMAAWPGSMDMRSNQGYMPFHYACLGPCPRPNLIRYLLMSSPSMDLLGSTS